MSVRSLSRACLVALGLAVLGSAALYAQQAAAVQKPFQPQSGQAGKDVVWVPTPQVLVDKMLDMAKAAPGDFVMDLGSGDGRTVITAAKRGITAMGIEYNPDMVELSKRNAAEAGVTNMATFVKADLFETDFSKATVITMFLLPDINLKLRPKILDMKAGTRVVSNSFTMDDWQADETVTLPEPCRSWCTALLWIVPAKVEGRWSVGAETLTLTQKFQMIDGTLGSATISAGEMNGESITFAAGGATYSGRVSGNTMQGTRTGGGSWRATRQ